MSSAVEFVTSSSFSILVDRGEPKDQICPVPYLNSEGKLEIWGRPSFMFSRGTGTRSPHGNCMWKPKVTKYVMGPGTLGAGCFFFIVELLDSTRTAEGRDAGDEGRGTLTVWMIP